MFTTKKVKHLYEIIVSLNWRLTFNWSRRKQVEVFRKQVVFNFLLKIYLLVHFVFKARRTALFWLIDSQSHAFVQVCRIVHTLYPVTYKTHSMPMFVWMNSHRRTDISRSASQIFCRGCCHHQNYTKKGLCLLSLRILPNRCLAVAMPFLGRLPERK